MSLMKSSNPAFGENVWGKASYATSAPMTLQGTINKTLISLLLVVASAAYTWNTYMQGGNVSMIMGVGFIGGFILSMVTIFKNEWAHITVPAYALFEGAAIGGLSALFEVKFPGLPMQATALTFGTLFVMLFAYKQGLIKATEKFRAVIMASMGAIMTVYIISMIMSFFGSYSFLQGNSLMSIVFSLVVTAVAALSLILDFDTIEKGVRNNAPKQFEWMGAFGLLVTLIWLYIEMLKLLSKISSKD
ncbi:MAG: Bax inhibitor-1/YccA family protein [Ichthyobacteriaceae bacterium]|nr:Bax inhibitor-1/YccA family protein [Ichthyobacteriaceae bacterium]